MRRLALACVVVSCCGHAAAAALTVELGSVSHAAFEVEGLVIELADDAASGSVWVRRLEAGGHRFENLRFTCAETRIALPRLACRDGELVAAGLDEHLNIDFEYAPFERSGRLRLASSTGDQLTLDLSADGSFTGRLADFDLGRIVRWMPQSGAALSGHFDGRVAGRLLADGPVRMRFDGRVSSAAFSSADGLHAAEGVGADLAATLERVGRDWAFSVEADWTDGEAYVHPIYTTAGMRASLRGTVSDAFVEFSRASLVVDGVDGIEARARFTRPDLSIDHLAATIAGADLAAIGPRFIAPLIAPGRPDSLLFDGRLSAGVMIEQGRVYGLDVALDGVTYEDVDASLAFGPLSGVVPWREDEATEAELVFEGGRWEKLELGAFEVAARLHGPAVDIDILVIPVLDGRVVLSDLALRRIPAGWSGSGAAIIEPISMPLLTTAVGLPEMAGVLSASLPGLKVSPGEITLDGALVVSVFDGYLRVTDLRAYEVFGVSSRLYSNVEARNLDLEQLTRTFEFGSITGFIDADVHALEMAHWRPIGFDARVHSSAGRYRKRISQRAVQNIGALAGPGAGAALQRGILGFFDSFGYRDIGLSCRLKGGVCIMGGIGDETAGSFDIVRGGGIPALNVIGYNRRVDWNELVDRLQRVIESNSAPVIR